MAGMIHCEPCQKQFTGQVPYHDHLMSEKHKKKVESMNFRKSWAESIGLQETSSGEGGIATIAREVSQLMCSTCNKSFSGPIPYKAHMDSEVHRKKVAQRNLVGNIKFNLPLINGHQTVPPGYIQISVDKLSCTACNLKFESLEKTLAHYESDEHREKKANLAHYESDENREKKGIIISSSGIALQGKSEADEVDGDKVTMQSHEIDAANVDDANNLTREMVEAPLERLLADSPRSSSPNVTIVEDDDDLEAVLGDLNRSGRK